MGGRATSTPRRCPGVGRRRHGARRVATAAWPPPSPDMARDSRPTPTCTRPCLYLCDIHMCILRVYSRGEARRRSRVSRIETARLLPPRAPAECAESGALCAWIQALRRLRCVAIHPIHHARKRPWILIESAGCESRRVICMRDAPQGLPRSRPSSTGDAHPFHSERRHAECCDSAMSVRTRTGPLHSHCCRLRFRGFGRGRGLGGEGVCVNGKQAGSEELVGAASPSEDCRGARACAAQHVRRHNSTAWAVTPGSMQDSCAPVMLYRIMRAVVCRRVRG